MDCFGALVIPFPIHLDKIDEEGPLFEVETKTDKTEFNAVCL